MVETIKDNDVALYADFDNRYVLRDGRFGVARSAIAAIPVIDMSPFVGGGSAAAKRETGRQLRSAGIDSGFFYVTGHGIAQSELDELYAWGHRFFERPFEEKIKLRRARSITSQGYIGIGGTKPDTNTNQAPDLKETFCIGRELVPGEPEEGRYGAGQNQWPDDMPGFREFLQAHAVKRIAMAQQLVRAFAVSLDLPEDHFDEIHRLLGCNLLYNYYPPMSTGADSTRWGISPHTDYGAFTILAQDDKSGLQVRNAAGDWIDVPPLPGTFVVNIADLFARWTNDLYVSSLHRAVNLNNAARISVPFFVFPHGRTPISCLATCQSPDNPPRYDTVIAEDYLKALLEQSDRTGRPGIAAQTVRRFQAEPAGIAS